jgi:hypothetical protein
MDAIVERVSGVDVGQAMVVATVLIGGAHQRPTKATRRFRTVTRDLLAMREWFQEHGVTHVALESTGVYWQPVYALLEDAFEMIVGNAHHIKNVPGRKTDVKDSEWLANLARHGLIAKSFVPPKSVRQLRDLVRYRRKLVESRTAERNRLLKSLETANIKLASTMSDVFGVSGMLMLRALLDGRTNFGVGGRRRLPAWRGTTGTRRDARPPRLESRPCEAAQHAAHEPSCEVNDHKRVIFRRPFPGERRLRSGAHFARAFRYFACSWSVNTHEMNAEQASGAFHAVP